MGGHDGVGGERVGDFLFGFGLHYRAIEDLLEFLGRHAPGHADGTMPRRVFAPFAVEGKFGYDDCLSASLALIAGTYVRVRIVNTENFMMGLWTGWGISQPPAHRSKTGGFTAIAPTAMIILLLQKTPPRVPAR